MTPPQNPASTARRRARVTFYVRGLGMVLAVGVAAGADRDELVRYTNGR